MKLKLIGASLALSLIIPHTLAFAADMKPVQPANPIHVFIDNKELASDIQPVMLNQSTMLPIRAIAEALGAKVTWGESNAVAIQRDSTSITLIVDSNKATVNGKEVQMDTPAILYNGRTMVPVRFMSENMDCDVQWDDKAGNVDIKRKVAKTVGTADTTADNQQKAKGLAEQTLKEALAQAGLDPSKAVAVSGPNAQAQAESQAMQDLQTMMAQAAQQNSKTVYQKTIAWLTEHVGMKAEDVPSKIDGVNGGKIGADGYFYELDGQPVNLTFEKKFSGPGYWITYQVYSHTYLSVTSNGEVPQDLMIPHF